MRPLDRNRRKTVGKTCQRVEGAFSGRRYVVLKLQRPMARWGDLEAGGWHLTVLRATIRHLGAREGAGHRGTVGKTLRA